MPDFIQEDIDKTATYAAQQDVAASLAAAQLAHQILDEIIGFIKPGIRESEVKNFAFSCYEKHALEKPWHMPYIRFGEHTLLTYRDKAKEDLVLNETDIAFADIGIVKNGIEGDAGRTVSFGNNPIFQNLALASKKIFDETLGYWKANNPTGIDLYKQCHEVTKRHGLAFNLDTAGHLIGQYPHKGWKKGLNTFPTKAASGVWVLEIQIRHPELPYGAFFEDLLY